VPVRVPIPPAPLTFRPLDGRLPHQAALGDWQECVIPARWQLTAMLPKVPALDRDNGHLGLA
jgi:hypothetical protein